MIQELFHDGENVKLAKRFRAFLDGDNNYSGKYRFQIHNFLENSVKTGFRLVIDLSDLREYCTQDVRLLLRKPKEVIPIYVGALHEYAQDFIEETFFKRHIKVNIETIKKLSIGFCGAFGYHRITPRELLSSFLNCMVKIEGVVTKISLITPKLQKSVQYSPIEKKYVVHEFTDLISLQSSHLDLEYHNKDESGNELETEYGLCKYIDFQVLSLQEAAEVTPPGQLPRHIDILLENDLVDLAKPGDRISVVGIYQGAPQPTSGLNMGFFKAEFIGNHVEVQSDTKVMLKSSLSEIQAIRNFVQCITKTTAQAPKEHIQFNRIKMLMLLADSFAPSIYGHEMVKRAIILQLVGGIGKTLENGTKLRGDINILMVGDPGVAKSQMLRAMMHISPIAVSTTGRGSSGVGLTAAVFQDKDTGERHLEAGAMVLADRGIVLIDEFDKMTDIDRVTIHEVMEQQTVTIAKAGLHTTLNARCSILAAANPIYGCYDSKLSIQRNINLPDSLLSRFDILFVLIDKSSHKQDKNIAEHVILMRKLAKSIGSMNTTYDLRDQSAVDNNNVKLEHENAEMDDSSKFFIENQRLLTAINSGKKLLKPAFIGKFASFIRNRPVKPTLITSLAQDRIISFYLEIRSHQDEWGLPITARTLETIIRIATANAKLCLDQIEITEDDVKTAEMVLRYSIQGDK
jgi:DNA replication licensing factor MCM3